MTVWKLKGKPLWIWDEKQRRAQDIKTRDGRFNHIIGLPVKGTERPLYSYQKIICDAWIITSIFGLRRPQDWRISELILRYMAWR